MIHSLKVDNPRPCLSFLGRRYIALRAAGAGELVHLFLSLSGPSINVTQSAYQLQMYDYVYKAKLADGYLAASYSCVFSPLP